MRVLLCSPSHYLLNAAFHLETSDETSLCYSGWVKVRSSVQACLDDRTCSEASKPIGDLVAIKIERPTVIQAAGSKPKLIEEFVGLVNSQTSKVSIARMQSPSGWSEPGQTPEFDEYTVVLRGMLRVETKTAVHEVHAGEAIMTSRGEWIRYSTPGPEGAEYVAVCLPAFSPGTVHRDA